VLQSGVEDYFRHSTDQNRQIRCFTVSPEVAIGVLSATYESFSVFLPPLSFIMVAVVAELQLTSTTSD
jgi:hypothetical protein